MTATQYREQEREMTALQTDNPSTLDLLSPQWRKTDRFESGWFLGSEDEDGSHRRDETGWPYSIYRKAAQIGVTDIVLCHGIQNYADASAMLRLLNSQGGN